MKRGHVLSLALAVCGGLLVVGCPTEQEREGDYGPAIPLQIAEWIKGGPVDVTDGRHIYLIEFWASWCPHCTEAIPRMTALQHQFGDDSAAVIAVAYEPADVIRPFVEARGDQMDYVVAIDDNRATFDDYGIQSVPRAFVVDRAGEMVWRGHPGDSSLDQVLVRLTARR
jgi:thiol-disulfide isomerase/thioredoxin